ncbi:MAG: hypothetical protein ACXADA_07080 [Candidatus Hodarchaeales archaeon]
MRTKMIIRYVIALLGILVIHFLVYIITPGNWLGAIIISFCSLYALLPSKESNNNLSQVKEDSLTFNKLASSINMQDLDDNNPELHSTLGAVFSTMVHDAALDLYSSEFTFSNDRNQKTIDNNDLISVKQPDDDSRDKIAFKETNIECMEPLNSVNTPDLPPITENIPVDVKLEVDHEGKLHYIFQENEITCNEGFHVNKNDQCEFHDDNLELLHEDKKMSTRNWLINTRDLYLLKFQQEGIVENQDLLLVLTCHLDRIKIIVDSLNDPKELELTSEILEPLEIILQNWLLEDRGLLHSNRPSNALCTAGRKVILPDRESLQIKQLNNYLGKLSSIIHYLTATGSFIWLLELENVVSEIQGFFPEFETDCLQAIKFEIASFLGEIISLLLSSDSSTSKKSSDSRQSSNMEA